MSKFFKSWKTGLTACAVVLLSVIGINVANAIDHNGDWFDGTSVAIQDYENYIIDCNEQGGYLTLVFTSSPGTNIQKQLYASTLENYGWNRVSPVTPEEVSDDGLTIKWYLPKGSYYIIFSSKVLPSCTASFEATSEGGSGASWTPIEMNQEYTTQPYNLIYTPETDGVLTVVQKGSYATDPFLYVNEACSTYAQMAGYSGSNPCTQTFNLSAGESYYYKSTSITSVTFSWEGKASDYKAAELNTDYTLNYKSDVMTFTPQENGTYLIWKKNAWFPYDNILWKDSAHTQNVNLDSQSTADDGEYAGTCYFYTLTAGTKYYLYHDNLSSATFQIQKGQDIVPQLESTYPKAGSALNASSAETKFSLTFNPNAVTIGSVDFVYTNAEKQTVTISNVYKEYVGGNGNWYILLPYGMNESGQMATSEKDNITSLIAAPEIKYILHDVKYNGSPVTETAITEGVEVNNGEITINFMADNPIALVGQTWPNPFYNYFEAGNQDAIATIEFDGAIASQPVVSIIQGKQVKGGQPGENNANVDIPEANVKVSGKTLTIDFSGLEGLKAIPAGTASVNITNLVGENGLTCSLDFFYVTIVDAPVFVPVEYLGTNPTSGSEIEVTDDNTASFTANFSGKVKVTDSGVWMRGYKQFDVPAVAAEGAEGEYATAWTFTFPADYVQAMLESELDLSCNFQVQDELGNYVVESANVDNVINVSFTPSKKIEPGMDYNVKIAENVDGRLDSFNVYLDGYYIDSNDYFEAVAGMNPFKSIKITGNDIDFTANAVAYDIESQTVTFEPAIRETGSYTIVLPYMAFTIGIHNTSGGLEGQDGNEGDLAYWSKAKEIQFNVTVTPRVYDTDPDTPDMEHGTEITADEPESANSVNRNNVTDVNFHWGDEYDAALNGDDKVVTIKKNEDGSNEKQLTPGIVDGALVIPVANYFKALEKNAENNGVYVINIPAETVVISKKAQAQGIALLADEAPVYNDEKNVYMNLDVMTGVISILDADANGLYRVYNLNGVNVLNTEDALEINNLVPGIYIVNGKKVAVK